MATPGFLVTFAGFPGARHAFFGAQNVTKQLVCSVPPSVLAATVERRFAPATQPTDAAKRTPLTFLVFGFWLQLALYATRESLRATPNIPLLSLV